MNQTKVCRKCNKRLHAQAFDKCKRGILGRRATCRHCREGLVPTEPPKKFIRPLAGERFLITSAQNATPIEPEFFKALQVAAKHLGATLVVIPLRYKNPTSLWSKAAQGEEWWGLPPVKVGRDAEGYPIYEEHEDNPFKGLLFNGRKKLNPNLVLVGDVKIQPTAGSPLSGFESLTGAESCIIGHPKMQFKTIAAPSGRFPKVLTTTGSCTKRNFTDTKAGKLGAFHHFLGAVVVEIEGKTFHLRQINADRADGSFIDLDKHYSAAGVTDAPPALGLVLGDTHVRVADPEVDAATFGPGGIVETLDPKTLVFHDLVDGETVNPHEVDDPFAKAAKSKAKRLDVREELQEVVEFVNERAGKRSVVIVDSNHHDFLSRWVKSTNWKHDPKNAAFYLESALFMLKSARMVDGGATYDDPFPYWMKKLGAKGNIRYLEPDESFKLADNECGMHGHAGPGGARGSVKNLSRLGAKVISGHGHSPAIEEGHYRSGTSSFRRLSYQRGPNASLNTHVVVYANGKRSLITIVDRGAWRLAP